MKKVLLAVMLGIVIVFIACTNVRSVKNVPRVSKDYLKSILGSPALFHAQCRERAGNPAPTDGKLSVGTGILQEITGKKRDKRFIYAEYISILSEGTGL